MSEAKAVAQLVAQTGVAPVVWIGDLLHGEDRDDQIAFCDLPTFIPLVPFLPDLCSGRISSGENGVHSVAAPATVLNNVRNYADQPQPEIRGRDGTPLGKRFLYVRPHLRSTRKRGSPVRILNEVPRQVGTRPPRTALPPQCVLRSSGKFPIPAIPVRGVEMVRRAILHSGQQQQEYKGSDNPQRPAITTVLRRVSTEHGARFYRAAVPSTGVGPRIGAVTRQAQNCSQHPTRAGGRAVGQRGWSIPVNE